MENKDILISIENVGLCYKRNIGFFKKKQFWALKDVSFDLYRGETLGIIGRNGVGKSTVLRLLAGIISPDKGKIVRHDSDIKISLIKLQAGFIPSLNGKENAILSGMMLGASKREIQLRLNEIIDFSGLEDFIDQPLHTYSTGMKARLGFSVAYYLDLDVILLDEVLGVGDKTFKEKSTDAMKKRSQSDKTVVLVSHNLDVVDELCDRLVWIENGVTQMTGNVKSVSYAYIEYLNQKKQKLFE